MRKGRVLGAILLISTILPFQAFTASAAGELKPFPQHTTYYSGTIKPNHVTQTQLDNDVKRIYDEWKARYLKQNPKASDQYYVFYNLEGEADPANAVSSSEGHGYGMLAAVLMAGYDTNAKTYFDGLYKFYKAHPSVNNSNLMAWQQIKDSSGNIIDNPDGGNDSATDGDMDIAYSLLLADKQWGSSGTINYLNQAKSLINAIMAKDVNSSEWLLKMGDWASNSDTQYGKGTRLSDYMLSHLKAFQTATTDANWANVTTKSYSIINTLYNNNSLSTGLMPDFAVYSSGSYVPAPSQYLEDVNDGKYYYNSSRTPWRIPVDYLLTGDTRAIGQLTTLNNWVKTKTSSNPNNIISGYNLNGTVISGETENSMAFVAPFAVSAMINSSNQTWLNSLWTKMANTSTSSIGYFENSIRLLVMITVSGNWWAPDSTSTPPSTSTTLVNDNFNSMTTGAAPTGYTTSGNVTIEDLPSSSNKSIKLNDTDTTNSVKANKSFATQTGKVTMEYKVMLPSAVNNLYVHLKQGSTIASTIQSNSDGTLRYRNGDGTMSTIANYSPNTWLTIKIEADVATNKSNVYVNGTSVVTGGTFRNSVTAIDSVELITHSTGTGTMYIDDVNITTP
ncbi:glycosyl hydrolase family 8 [Paenibacillus sp. UNC451MF]|uniref:glycosyl hydrolase family 8 n=1 Tax=Paenibacillus sp. UNC451MF TaxID=1449063 RepID=UPI0007E8D0A8|nr:glycosyl hydrolase family 8 [Paenibacillus sp. UNC451MF]